ncbi:MAG: aspartate-semialdehyde dehydrogenase [Candidatus Korobacteraceae bacterium]
MAKIPVGILGATGMVGQRFIQLLERHPWFEVSWVAASERSFGKSYAEAAKWKMKTPIPARIARMQLSAAEPAGAPKVIFAALDADIAREMEPSFADAGCAVISNSSAFRMHPQVPLVIPEINADHIKLIAQQSWRKRSGGFMVTNSNCSVMGLALALAPLQKAFGVEAVFAVTMQAISGAGYPGVASLDILGNVVPFIKNEEEKMQEEAGKLLGKLKGGVVVPADFRISSHCNRVAVEDGHTESISIKLKKRATPEKIIAAWREYRGQVADLKLPFAPPEPIFYDERPDRPQPRLDIERGHGMTVSCGRLRPCSLLDWKFTMLSHNTIRGAAGAALLNAELLKARGYLE